MPISAKNLRIGGAVLIAMLLVGIGYALPGMQFPETKAVNAELTDELLADYIAKDTDEDGLPDWQESLYGTDSNNPDTDGDGVSDGDAVRRGLLTPTALASQLPTDPVGEEDIPGTAPEAGGFTDRFARAFFEAYVRESGGRPMSEEAQQALIAKLMGVYIEDAARSLNSPHAAISIRTDASATASAYIGSVERVLDFRDEPDADMFVLAQKVIEEGDSAAAARLAELGSRYSQTATQLLSVPAPPSYRDTHVRLVQSIDQAGRAATALSNYEKDPLLTMAALSVLAPARTGILGALETLAEGIVAMGEPAAGAPGATILRVVRSAKQP